jgi:hypothetical protein
MPNRGFRRRPTLPVGILVCDRPDNLLSPLMVEADPRKLSSLRSRLPRPLRCFNPYFFVSLTFNDKSLLTDRF